MNILGWAGFGITLAMHFLVFFKQKNQIMKKDEIILEMSKLLLQETGFIKNG